MPVAPPAADEVVLLDEAAHPIGTTSKASVHHTETPLHLAFSVHLIDPEGRTLLTRRSLAKATWPGVWTNSCCGHPRPGEAMTDAVRRRVGQELGLADAHLGDVRPVLPDFTYRAVDASGIVEHEVCPVHVAAVPSEPTLRPDPDEVAEHAWVPWVDVHGAVLRTPQVFSPWMVLQVRALGPELPTSATLAPGSTVTQEENR